MLGILIDKIFLPAGDLQLLDSRNRLQDPVVGFLVFYEKGLSRHFQRRLDQFVDHQDLDHQNNAQHGCHRRIDDHDRHQKRDSHDHLRIKGQCRSKQIERIDHIRGHDSCDLAGAGIQIILIRSIDICAHQLLLGAQTTVTHKSGLHIIFQKQKSIL